MTPDVHRDWPLVGRAGELRLVTATLARSDAGGLALVGPPGVGKTRLAAAALAAAERAGLPTARVTATRAAADVSFGALHPLLDAHDPQDGGGGEDSTPAYRAELLRRAAAALAARAGDRRLVLQIDNAHFLDDASATLVHQLAGAGAAVLLLTLGTDRPPPPGVVALWKDGLVTRFDVPALDGAAIDDLLGRVLGGPLDSAAVARLAAHSQGNLLYLRELVVAALDSGALVDDAGMWRLLAMPTVSPRLAELLEVRLAGLDPARRSLVEAVALGEPIGAAELAALGDPADAEALEARGLLIGLVDGRRLELRVGHPLYGRVLRAGISTLRRRAVLRTLADTVAATGARRAGDLVRMTGWRLEAGGASAAELLEAAETARRAFDFAAAERFARAAAAAGAGFDALVVGADLAALQGRGTEADAELAALKGEDDRERARLAVARMDNLRFVGRFDDALDVAARSVLEIAPGPLRDEIEARRAGLLLAAEGPDAAARAARAIRAAYPDPAGAPGAAVAWACLICAQALTRTGAADAAVEAVAAGQAAHLTAEPPARWPSWVLDLARAEALASAGRPAEAETLAGRRHDLAIDAGAIDAQAYAAATLARAALARGRVHTAGRWAREAVTLLRSLGRLWMLPGALASLARAEALGRRTTQASAALAELDALALPATAWIHADVLGARAWTAAAAGDVPAACGLLTEAADWGERTGDRLGALTALHDLGRLGRARGVEARLRGLADGAAGDLAPAQVAHVAALARGDAAGLAAAAEAFETQDAWLLAAEATADAAVAWRRAGRPKPAGTAQRLAEDRATRCEGAATPALSALEARAVLTPAEREAALLAGAGRSNREIAAELHLSVRTVENRLQRTYEKLGVSSRAELAGLLA